MAKIPFRYATRRRHQPIPIQSGATFAENGQFSAQIPKVGFLSAIGIRLNNTITLSDAGALKLGGPWNLIKNLEVVMNVGANTLYQTTGHENFVVQRLLKRGHDPSGDSTLYLAPVAKGANTWALTYWIPISMNQGEQFDIGLINMQSPEVQVEVRGTFGAGLDVSTLVTAATGSLQMYYVYYELPDPNQVEYPPVIYHRIMSQNQVIAATGDQTVTVPREGILYRLAHIFQGNDALDDTVDNFRVMYNKTDTVVQARKWEMKQQQNMLYGGPAIAGLPAGIYCHDFWAAQGAGEAGFGDNRDVISTEALSTLESITNYTGAVAGTVNRINTIREFVQLAGR